MDERNNDFDFDFMPIGQAIKKARTARGMTKEHLHDPKHLQAIENEGQYPSLELFIQRVTMFDVSVDEYIFLNKEVKKCSVRRRLDTQLNKLDDRELSVIEATVNGLTTPKGCSDCTSWVNIMDCKAPADRKQPAATGLTEIALAVIRGEYGNGDERRARLKAAGYDYAEVQSLVNKML